MHIPKGLSKVVTQSTAKAVLVAKHHSPLILTTAGIVGLVTSGILAARATLKLEDTLEVIDDAKNIAKKKNDRGEFEGKAFQRQMLKIHTKGAVDMVKLYGPSVTLGVVSIVCIAGAHNILSKRNVALVAAYKGLEETYSEYRRRVIEEFGEDKDREFRTPKFHTVEETDEKTGEAKLVNKPVSGTVSPAMYGRLFDNTNVNAVGNPLYNKIFLEGKQNYINDLLVARGHVFLNDVYDQLGFERTKPGSVVGWAIGRGREGDGFIEFGLDTPEAHAFFTGEAPGLWLDFNVDGVVFDLLDE